MNNASQESDKIVSFEDYKKAIIDSMNPTTRFFVQTDPGLKYVMLANAYSCEDEEEELDTMDTLLTLYGDTEDKTFMTLFVAVKELLVLRKVVRGRNLS